MVCGWTLSTASVLSTTYWYPYASKGFIYLSELTLIWRPLFWGSEDVYALCPERCQVLPCPNNRAGSGGIFANNGHLYPILSPPSSFATVLWQVTVSPPLDFNFVVLSRVSRCQNGRNCSLLKPLVVASKLDLAVTMLQKISCSWLFCLNRATRRTMERTRDDAGWVKSKLAPDKEIPNFVFEA